jgi:hypothetical protein
MKKLIISVLTALILVAVMAAPAVAAEERNLDASVTVSIYINFTITDPTSDGIVFASGDPGATVQDAETITLAVGSDTNVDVSVYLKADDLTGPGTAIPATNVKYDDDATFGEGSETDDPEGTMATTYGTAWYTVTALTGDSQTVYHQLTIPDPQQQGTYTGKFYYKAE